MTNNTFTMKEAAQLACPMGFFTGLENHCIGGSCMAWQYVTPHRFVARRRIVCSNPAATEEPDRPANVPPNWVFIAFDGEDPSAWYEPEWDWEARQVENDGHRRGYCGLLARAGQ